MKRTVFSTSIGISPSRVGKLLQFRQRYKADVSWRFIIMCITGTHVKASKNIHQPVIKLSAETKHRSEHNKPTQWSARPAKDQISRGVRQVWPACVLSACTSIRSLLALEPTEDSDQTAPVRRVIEVFAGSTWHLLVLSCSSPKSVDKKQSYRQNKDGDIIYNKTEVYAL